MVGGWWQTEFNVSTGPGLLSRSKSRSGPDWDMTWTGPGPDLGPGLGPGMGPGPELDNNNNNNNNNNNDEGGSSSGRLSASL